MSAIENAKRMTVVLTAIVNDKKASLDVRGRAMRWLILYFLPAERAISERRAA